MTGESPAVRWLVVVIRLPANPSRHRVGVWRELRRVGAIPLGGLTQIASAFGQVQTSLSWFVNTYSTLANWKASVDRLLTFHRALEDTAAEQAQHPALDVQRDGEPTPPRLR